MADIGRDTHLVFAMDEDPEDENSKLIMFKVPHAMVNSWIKCTPELNQEMEIYIDRLVKAVSKEEVQLLSDEEMDEFSNKHGFNQELQSMMMRAVIDLRKILGDEDFIELYKTDGDIETDHQDSRWSALSSDGSVEIVHDPDLD